MGDVVVSRNERSGATEYKTIVGVTKKTAQTLVTLHLADATTGKEVQVVQATPEHPFRVFAKGWVRAGQLGIGTSIVTRAGPALVVIAIEHQERAEGYSVYNLTVDQDHTYFVGAAQGGTWVHNSGGCVPAIARTIGIVERDGDVVRIVGNGPNGAIEVIACMKREGARIILSGAHIDGPGSGKMGIRELSAFAKQFGRNENVKEIIIEGAKRTTGARPGHVPRPFTFSVD